MGTFADMFGGDSEKQAADANRGLYNQYRKDGVGFLSSGLESSIASLGKGYGDANATLADSKNIWGNYGTTANSAFDKGLTGSLAALGSARAAYDPVAALAAKYGGATSTLLDSLGVNGAAGNANAVNAFQTGPGYNFALDQGNNAINRRRAAGGMLNSGNADIDALKFGQGLANQEYGNWQTKLGAFAPLEANATSQAATGRAGVDTNIASLYSTDASNRAGVAGNVATGQTQANTGIASNQTGLGNTMAGLYTGYGSDLTNLYGNVTSGLASANNQEAAGKAAGMKNLAGLGQSLLGSAVNFAGGGFGGLGGAANMFQPKSTAFSGFNVTGLPGA